MAEPRMRVINQGVNVADLPEDAHVTVTVLSDLHPKASNVYTFRMLKGSPLRKLLELQELFEEGFDNGEAARAGSAGAHSGRD